MTRCERCDGAGTIQVDGHEVRCVCVRELAADKAELDRLCRLVGLAEAEQSDQRRRERDGGQQSERDGLLALWRATAALRAHAREVGL